MVTEINKTQRVIVVCKNSVYLENSLNFFLAMDIHILLFNLTIAVMILKKIIFTSLHLIS